MADIPSMTGTSDERPLDSLDIAFDLPDDFCRDEPKYRTMYEVLVENMRREAKNLPMNTVQQLLIERIAINYVILKRKELHPIGDAQGFASASVQKDYNTFWLAMTKEFNAMIVKGSKTDREATLVEVRDIILRTLAKVNNKSVKDELMAQFAEEFERAGL